MTTQEFSTEFDVLYDNISSGQAPGLTEYEKSIFLTKAQSEIIKNYFNPKGNKYQEGFDDSPKRQIDFSMLIKTTNCAQANPMVNLHFANNVGYYIIPEDVLMYVNEFLDVVRKSISTKLVVIPLSYIEYNRLMSKPFKRPLKNQAWRLISSGEGTEYTFTDYGAIAKALYDLEDVTLSFEEIYKIINGKKLTIQDNNLLVDGSLFGSTGLSEVGVNIFNTDVSKNLNKKVEATTSVVQIIPGPNDKITNYIVRYVRRPLPIILEDLSNEEGLSIEGQTSELGCELDPILHQEILQRAVELAKAAYTGDVTSAVELGNRSE